MSDLQFNVAQLLRENVGARRQYEFNDPSLPLSDELTLVPLDGHVKFTRTKSGVLATAKASGAVIQTCGRCLTDYQQPISVAFDEEFFATIHVTMGTPLPKPDVDDAFVIDENHMLDLGNAIREYTLLALPIAPVCREDCQGLCPHCGVNRNESPCSCIEEITDERMAALRKLLDN
jgi:uncharacterized protein